MLQKQERKEHMHWQSTKGKKGEDKNMKAYTQTQKTQKTCVRVHSGSQRRNVKWQAAQSRLVVTWYMIFLLERRERGTWNLLILVFKSQGSDVEHGQKDKHAGSKDKHVGSPLAPCSLFSTTCWSCWSDAGTWTTTFNPNHKNKHQSWEQTNKKRAHDWATTKQACAAVATQLLTW
jgi:hypothetical protein